MLSMTFDYNIYIVVQRFLQFYAMASDIFYDVPEFTKAQRLDLAVKA
jgi:hypothetical protein